MREHDVEGEQRGVGERPSKGCGVAVDADIGEQVDAGAGKCEGGEVPAGSAPDEGEQDRPCELDCGDGAEWEPVDGDVEAVVHQREHGAERDHESLHVALGNEEHPPWPPPDRKHDSSGDDTQPRHAAHRDRGEEQHSERGSQVVEDRRTDEPEVWRDSVRSLHRRAYLTV